MNKTILAMLILLGLYSCADTAQAPQTDIGKTNGYVYANFPLQGIGWITLKQVKGQASGVLRPDWSDAITTRGVWLPQGTYRLDGWESSDGDAYPLVKVVAGRVTDLGNIVPVSIGNYQIVALPVHHPEADKTIESALATLRPYLVSQQPIEWDPKVVPLPGNLVGPSAPLTLGVTGAVIAGIVWESNRPSAEKQLRDEHQIDEFFRLAKLAAPPVYRKPAADDSGSLYYGGGLGQIRVRHADGSWGAIDTGTLSSISAVRIAGGAWYIGAENGAVRQSLDQGRSWRVIASVAGEPVIDVEPSGGRLVLVTEHLTHAGNSIVADRLKLYNAPGNGGVAVALREVLLDGAPWPATLSYAAQAFGGKLYIGAANELYALDLATLAWSKLSPPISVSSFFVAPSSGLITAYHVGTFSSDLAFSTDHGATWQRHAALPSGHADVYFSTSVDGRAVLWSALAGNSALQPMKYDAAADRWSADGEPVKGCATVLHDPDFHRLGCVSPIGTIVGFDGAKWVGEFSAE